MAETGGEDRLEHPLGVASHLAVPKAQHLVAAPRQILAAPSVGGNCLCVLAAVQFDHQARSRTAEIRDVAADAVLSSEQCTRDLALAQVLPELAFRVGGAAPQLARDRCGLIKDFYIFILNLPLKKGREPGPVAFVVGERAFDG